MKKNLVTKSGYVIKRDREADSPQYHERNLPDGHALRSQEVDGESDCVSE